MFEQFWPWWNTFWKVDQRKGRKYDYFVPHSHLCFHNVSFYRNKEDKYKLPFSSVSCLVCCSQKGEQTWCWGLLRWIYLGISFLAVYLPYECFFIVKLNKGERLLSLRTAFWATDVVLNYLERGGFLCVFWFS